MRLSVMFITAVCVLFLVKLRWPKKKSIYDIVVFVRHSFVYKLFSSSILKSQNVVKQVYLFYIKHAKPEFR